MADLCANSVILRRIYPVINGVFTRQFRYDNYSATVVLNRERGDPARAQGPFPGAIVRSLSTRGRLPFAQWEPISFAVASSSFVTSIRRVTVVQSVRVSAVFARPLM